MTNLPFGMTPAPAAVEMFVSAPLDLGDEDERFRGWKIVVDLGAPVSINDSLGALGDESLSSPQRMAAMNTWLKQVLIAWNFTRIVVNEDGTTTTEMLRQPREGGIEQCPQSALPAIAKTVAGAFSVEKK